MKKSVFVFVLISIVFLIGFALSFAVAEELSGAVAEDGANIQDADDLESASSEEAREESSTLEADETFADAELSESAGITPDSAFYVIEDKILIRFRDDIHNREKKMAEMSAMVNEGKTEEARVALGHYRRFAEQVEEEINPSDKEEARRSAAAIRNTLKEIDDKIPDEQRKEFVEDVLKKENSIVTAAEIAFKIRDLCDELSKIDLDEYSRVCKVKDDENAPEWRKKHDRELTNEQREQAKKFAEIMKGCFKTAGQECDCEEIPHKEFADACKVAAPLATKCELEGDEAACEEMDKLEMPELPDYLQDVFDELEGVTESRYDSHMPEECQEAGAKTPRDCMKVMINANAPEECQSALIEANVDSEKEARNLCEKIMFEQYAPEECVKAGIRNQKECGKLMFTQSAPQECIDAGLTGESPSDGRKCEKIMGEQQGGDREGLNRGPRGGFGGPDCKRIQDSGERLKCYDGALENVEQFRDERREDFKEGEFGNQRDERRGPGGGVPPECAGRSPEECRGIMQERFGNRPPEEFREGSPEFNPEFRPGDEFEQERREEFREGEFENREPPANSGEQGGFSGEGGSGGGEGSLSGGEGSSGSSAPPEGGVTGGVITGRVVGNNNFLRYFFRVR